MPQPVAQGLGFGHGQLAVQQQPLGPAGEVLGGKDQFQPDSVAAPQVEGRVARPVALAARMRSSTRARWRCRNSKVLRSGWLVGEEDLEACPSRSVKRSWAPGWASSRRQIARVPTGQEWRSIQPVSSPTSAPWRTWPSPSIAGIQVAWAGRGSPRRGGRQSACPPRTPRRARAGAKRTGCWPRRCRFGPGPAGHSRRRGAGPGRGRPARSDHRWHQRGRCLAAGSQPAAHLGPCRGPGRPAAGGTRTIPWRCLPRLLGITVASTRVASASMISSSTSGWAPTATRGRGMGPGGPQPGQSVRVGGDPLDDPPGGRGRGHRAEQLRLVPQHRQVGKAVPTIGQHHRQVPQHRRVRMAATVARLVPASDLVNPTRSASSPSNAAPAWPTTPTPSVVTSKLDRELVACTRKVPSLTTDTTFAQPYPPWSGGHFHNQAPATSHPMKSRG